MSGGIKYKTRTATTRIILHDSHTSTGQSWHPEARDGGLKMGLLGIGYHFIIERDALVIETRERHLIGTHTPGHNMDSIGVCLVGGRDELGLPADNFTPAQYEALMELLWDLRVDYPGAKLFGHSEVQRYRNKTLPNCPFIDMDDLRQDLAVYALTRPTSGGPVRLAP